MKPFNLIRAVFWLLALIIAFELITAVMGGILCWWVNYTGSRQPGACIPASELISNLFNEILTAVLALLLAGRPPPP